MKKAAVLMMAAVAVLASRPAAGQAPSLSVVTFNVYDAFFGPRRAQRMQAIPEAVMALDPVPDLLVFEEAFKERDREVLISGLKANGYPVVTAHYVKKLYGTGILLVSRFPVESAEYTPYRVDGALFDVEHYAGKGVIHYLVKTPYGPLDLFATHPIARWKPLYDEQGNHNDRDRQVIDRLLEMERLSRVIESRRMPGGRSVIVAGDLNASPDMWSYQFLLKRAGLADSFYAVHPGEYASTYSPENTMVDIDWSRIDHVLFRNREGADGFWLRPVRSEVVFKQTVVLEGGVESSLSDHFGVLTIFQVMDDRAAALMSPAPLPPGGGGVRSGADLTEGGLLLTPENRRAWQSWAVETMDLADRRYNRFCQKVVPAARTVIAGEVSGPVLIPLTPRERMAIELDLVGSK